jgi:hypothetical protein
MKKSREDRLEMERINLQNQRRIIEEQMRNANLGRDEQIIHRFINSQNTFRNS